MGLFEVLETRNTRERSCPVHVNHTGHPDDSYPEVGSCSQRIERPVTLLGAIAGYLFRNWKASFKDSNNHGTGRQKAGVDQ